MIIFHGYLVALKMIMALQKKNIPIYFLLILLGGLFWSRALLSITTAIWTIYAIYYLFQEDRSVLNSNIFKWSLFPIIPWLLGAWQHPFDAFNYDYLLTLLAYPSTILIIHATPKKLLEKEWTKIWIIATAVSLTYPLFWYFKNIEAATNAYGRGESLPTFMDTDHVRYSIFLCSSLLILLYARFFSKKIQLMMGAILFAVILFLSVRTGWVLSICILVLYGFYCLQQSKKIKPKQLLFGTIIFIAISFISYYLFPTIQQKAAYSIWEYQQYQSGVYHPNNSDGPRRNINEVSWKLIENNSSINEGWQGISTTLQQAYSSYFKLQKIEFGWPFNQWLYWWLGSGWWGMLLFSGWLFYPLTKWFGKKNNAITSWTIAIALSCLVETTLNYQYGVLLHVLPIALFWKISAISTSDNS